MLGLLIKRKIEYEGLEKKHSYQEWTIRILIKLIMSVLDTFYLSCVAAGIFFGKKKVPVGLSQLRDIFSQQVSLRNIFSKITPSPLRSGRFGSSVHGSYSAS